MILNGVMALTLLYFTEFGEPAFQHIIASARIKLIDQKYPCITHIGAVKFACVTKCKNFSRTFNLSFKFHFTVAFFVLMLGFRLR